MRLLALLILTLLGMSGAAGQEKFKVGIAAQTINMLPVWMAEAGGFFKQQGLDVEIVNMEGGSRGLRAVMSGELHAMNVGLSAVVEANSKGADLRLIASSSNTMRFGFFAASDVKNAVDLKGQKVGISSFGSESDVATTLALQQLGLSRQDVTVVEIGGTLRRLAALKAGEIKATPLNEPANIMAQQQGLPKLIDLAEKVPWIFNGVVVSRSHLQTQRENVTRFLTAYLEGTYLALSDEKGAKAVLAKVFKTENAAVINGSYDDFKRLMPGDAEPSRAGAENVIAQIFALGTAVGSKNLDDYVDASLIELLKIDGFIDELRRKYAVR
jgi:ABC-type nitrate/sulfonate/bicarbonate transport system substrate-binding protein